MTLTDLGLDLATFLDDSSLHRSVVQRHAEMESDSTFLGLHEGEGDTGLSRLPSKILVEKHSLISAEITNNQ